MNFGMDVPHLEWNLTPAAAMARQTALAARVRAQDDFGAVNFIAGVDVGFQDAGATARAAIAVVAFPTLELVETVCARRAATFPYIPGLLAFREMPVILDALQKLTRPPDVLMMDGHGFAHPRRFGIACYLGVALDKPTIGCAKSILVGHADPPENRVGAWTPLLDKDEIIGAALRTKLNTKRVVNPLYVSVGHRVTLQTACALILKCCKGYRLPETIRYAHNAASHKE